MKGALDPIRPGSLPSPCSSVEYVEFVVKKQGNHTESYQVDGV